MNTQYHLLAADAVDGKLGTTDLKEPVASISGFKTKTNKQRVEMNKLSAACLLLAASLVYFSILKIEVVYSFET
jgi:hypothetical protein